MQERINSKICKNIQELLTLMKSLKVSGLTNKMVMRTDLLLGKAN